MRTTTPPIGGTPERIGQETNGNGDTWLWGILIVGALVIAVLWYIIRSQEKAADQERRHHTEVRAARLTAVTQAEGLRFLGTEKGGGAVYAVDDPERFSGHSLERVKNVLASAWGVPPESVQTLPVGPDRHVIRRNDAQ